MDLRALLLVSSAVAALAAGCTAPGPARRTADAPNIVLVLADDLGWGELGCYGQSRIRTPNLDRLAREGMRFTQHYSGAPVCAPARCVLLTGRHAGHAEIRGNREYRNARGRIAEGQQPISDDALTIAEVLRDAGYATAAFGKWGLGPVGTSGAPNAQGFDEFFGYNCQRQAHSYYPSHLWHDAVRVPLNGKPIPGRARLDDGPVRYEDWTGERYAPDAMLAAAVRFLRTPRDRPFFLYLPFVEPHVAMQPPRALVESYPREWDDRPYRGQCGYLPHPRPRAGYAAMITGLDAHVGTILRTLDELGLADDTLVVFTSDNGPTHDSQGDPVFGVGGVDTAFFDSTAGLRGRKGSVYEGGLRVPLIVRWPGCVAAGSTCDVPSYFPDHFATLCDVAGVRRPDRLDGVSLLPAWLAPRGVSRRAPMVWVYPEYGGQVALRDGDLKLVRRGLADRPLPWELYDIARDPGETQDLAAQRPEVVERLARLLRDETDANPLFPVDWPDD